MRGKDAVILYSLLDYRITPAYAGKRNASASELPVVRDHPCVCGEKKALARLTLKRSGSPLRMRGKGCCGF